MLVLEIAVALVWLVVIALAILVVLLYRQFGLVYIGSGRKVALTGLGEGKRAPDNLEAMVDGVPGRLSWASAGPGRGTLLIFGGPRCPICEKLMPSFNDVADLWGQLVDMVFVDRPVKEGDHGRSDLPADRRWRYVFSSDSRLFAEFDVEVSPYAFLVDNSGTVLNKRIVNSPDHIAMVIENSVDVTSGMLGSASQPLHLGPRPEATAVHPDGSREEPAHRE